MNPSYRAFYLGLATYVMLYTPLFTLSARADIAANVAPEKIHGSGDDLDLISLLNSGMEKNDRLFTEAIELLESIRSSPSCNQIAASKLITSCQFIGRKPDTSTDPDTYNALEHTRSLYAARLALCELSGAGTPIPPPCYSLNASSSPRKGFFGFLTRHNAAVSDPEAVKRDVLEPCLKSLESRPQWWTSYSNGRQNAVVICQASRTEIEKGEILELYNNIAQSSTKLNNGLQEALRRATEESSRYRAFAQSTELWKNEIMREMEDSTSAVRIYFEKMSLGLETQFGSLFQMITSALENVHVGVTDIKKGVQKSSTETSYLRQSLQALHNESLLRSEEIALTQKQNALVNNELSLSLQSHLQSIAQKDIVQLVEKVKAFDTALDWLYGKGAQILQQEDNISQRLQTFESSLQNSSILVENLRKIQQQQYETATAQSQLQEVLQTNMRISKALLEQTASTAADLETMIDEASKKYRGIPGFGGLFGGYSTWALGGLLFCIGLHSPKTAVALLLLFILSR
ncbi:putative nuclear membrane fusion protein Kar5 [Aspergillus lucknowensis]|uniref:Nuclear membrane fusion protein Kar5 n=1 Tax=Aspergillus lucknowensis TaxID=176173 RepID=A0ABR4M2U7_9EURO